MQIPSVMFIEAAMDTLKDLSDDQKAGQEKELMALGDARAKQLGASGLSDDFKIGYQLGLQTGRVMNAGSPLLAINNIDSSKLY